MLREELRMIVDSFVETLQGSEQSPIRTQIELLLEALIEKALWLLCITGVPLNSDNGLREEISDSTIRKPKFETNHPEVDHPMHGNMKI